MRAVEFPRGDGEAWSEWAQDSGGRWKQRDDVKRACVGSHPPHTLHPVRPNVYDLPEVVGSKLKFKTHLRYL